MKDIKIIRIERLDDFRVSYGIIHKYLLHREDGGTPFHIHINHIDYQDSQENLKHQIESSMQSLLYSIRGMYGNILNFWDILRELKDLESV